MGLEHALELLSGSDVDGIAALIHGDGAFHFSDAEFRVGRDHSNGDSWVRSIDEDVSGSVCQSLCALGGSLIHPCLMP